MAIDRVAMPEQDAGERATNFTEVNLGLTEELAVREANRCIACKNRPCVAGCPVEVRIPDFLERIAVSDFAGAAEVLLTDNALPATTGRVCPQEVQCEGLCLRGKKGEPVAIGWLERFVADWAAANTEFVAPRVAASGHKVAVVGAGPVFWANGYGKGGICLKLGKQGDKITADVAWTSKDMDCQHGGYVIHQGDIYGNHGGGWAAST